ELADRTRDYAHLHLAGPQAASVYEKLIEKICLESFTHELVFSQGFDLICSPGVTPALWQVLTEAGARPAGLDAFELLRVEAGVPVFGKDIDEERFVVEINRIPQTICYTKGCFLGQEPIVMARDRGHVNRKLLGIKITGEGLVPHGAKLLRDGAEAGQITS